MPLYHVGLFACIRNKLVIPSKGHFYPFRRILGLHSPIPRLEITYNEGIADFISSATFMNQGLVRRYLRNVHLLPMPRSRWKLFPHMRSDDPLSRTRPEQLRPSGWRIRAHHNDWTIRQEIFAHNRSRSQYAVPIGLIITDLREKRSMLDAYQWTSVSIDSWFVNSNTVPSKLPSTVHANYLLLLCGASTWLSALRDLYSQGSLQLINDTHTPASS